MDVSFVIYKTKTVLEATNAETYMKRQQRCLTLVFRAVFRAAHDSVHPFF